MPLDTALPSAHLTQALAEFFKVFGDSSRLRILFALKQAPQTVTALASRLDLSVSAVSHQLKLLRHHRLVRFERQGHALYYQLCDAHIEDILSLGLDHAQE